MSVFPSVPMIGSQRSGAGLCYYVVKGESRPMHDDHMPQGWHLIKSVLLKELKTASSFHLCHEAAQALFHARLIGESISREASVYGGQQAAPSRFSRLGRDLSRNEAKEEAHG